MTIADPSIPKRPRGRPCRADAPTAAERQAMRRAAGALDMLLPPGVAQDARALRDRDGDLTLVAAVARAIRAALAQVP